MLLVEFCLSILGSAACNLTGGAVPPSMSLGSVMMWRLFLFNPSTTFRVCCITVAAFSLMNVRFIFPMSRSLLKIAGVLALFEPASSVGVLPESCGAGGEIVSVLAGFLSGLLAGSRAAGWFETEGLEGFVSLLSLPFLFLVGYF